MKNPIKIFLTFFLILFSFLFLFRIRPANAFTVRTGDNLVLPQNRTIEGSLIISGQHVTVNSPVKGDIYCAGQTVEINSNVDGDIICAGQNIIVNGQIDGNLRIAGQTLSFGGTVGRNVTVAGQSINSNLAVGGEMLVAGQQFSMNGSTAGDLRYFGENANVNGEVGRNFDTYVEHLSIGSQADIKGKVTYESANKANVDRNAKIAGAIKQNIPHEKSPITRRQRETDQIGRNFLGSFVIGLAIALILSLLWPLKIIKATDDMRVNFWKSLGIGLVVSIIAPVVAFALIFTIIGIPVSVLIIVAYIIALYVSRILVGILIGRIIVDNYWPGQKNSILTKTLIGVVVVSLLFAIPFLGWLFSFLAVLWGLAGIYYFFRPLTTE